MLKKSNEIDVTKGNLIANIFIFSLPIMAMNILQLLFNAADMIVVGRFAGVEPFAAVGATGPLINLIINLFMGLSVGTVVVVSQEFGAGDSKGVVESVHTSILFSIILGIFVMVLGLFIYEPLLVLMGTPEEILPLASLYIKIYFFGLPAAMVYNFCASILRAVGDSKNPMYFLVIGGIVNVILNLIFVIVFHMSVAGVAFATVISQYLSMVLILIFLYRHEGLIRFKPKYLRLEWEKLVQIFRIGFPAGMQGLLFSISNTVVQSSINSFGTTTIAANTAALNVEGFVATTTNAYYNAAITFTGQSMGAKKYDTIDSVAKVCTALIFATWLILGSLVIIFGRPLLSIFNSDPEVLNLGMHRIFIMMSLYFTCAFMNVFPGITRGMGYSILPMLCTLVGACLLRIVWIYSVFKWYPTITVLYLCYPVTWSIAGLGQVLIFFYARKRIRKKHIVESTT